MLLKTAVVFATVVAVANGFLCSTNQNCGGDRCCRQIFIWTFEFRICLPLTGNNEQCSLVQYVRQPDAYRDFCPCGPDLQCVQDKTSNNPLVGICRPVSRSCTSGSECLSNECCATLTPNKGKKKRQASGVCQPLKTVGGQCFTQQSSGQPKGVAQHCPCKDDLRCVPDYGFLPPHGPTGTCQENKCSRGTDCNHNECCHFQLVRNSLAPAFGRCIPADSVYIGYCERSCYSEKDCGEGACCEAPYQPKGRKKRLSIALRGNCKPLGGINSVCPVSGPTGPVDGMHYVCPCNDNLSCEDTDGSVTVPLNTGTCQNPPTACATARCASGYCCVPNILPIGRKKRGTLTGGFTCKPFGTQGSTCIVGAKVSTGGYCPCESPYSCEPSNPPVFIPAAGQVGTCQNTVGACATILCEKGHCCVPNISPIGRKKRGTFLGGATCKPLGTQGSNCIVGATGAAGGYCPCDSQHSCVPTNPAQTIVPGGELGTCQPN